MKRLLILIAGGALALAIGCNKDKDKDKVIGPQPSSMSIQIIDTLTQYRVFDTIHYALTANVPSGVSSASAAVILNNVVLETSFEQGLDSALVSIGDTLEFVVTPDYIDTTLYFSFTLTDLLGEVLSDTISAIIAESDIDYIYNRSLAGYNNSVNTGAFYDILTDTSYFAANIRNKTDKLMTIDLIFCYEATAKRSIGAPNSNWLQKVYETQVPTQFWPMTLHENGTMIYDLGVSNDFDKVVSKDQISDLIEGIDPVDSVKLVDTGRVIAFKLDTLSRNGKVGILKVISTFGSSVQTGGITIDAKIEK